LIPNGFSFEQLYIAHGFEILCFGQSGQEETIMKTAILHGFGIALVSGLMSFSLPASIAHAGNASQLDASLVETVSQKSGERRRNDYGRMYRGDKHKFHRKNKRNLGRHICSPREAVHKVRRFGVRGAEIKRINHRMIVVSGRKYRERIVVGMERRSRHCEIAFVRGGHRGFKNRGYRY
jgi:hypothetical protein